MLLRLGNISRKRKRARKDMYKKNKIHEKSRFGQYCSTILITLSPARRKPTQIPRGNACSRLHASLYDDMNG